MRNLFFAALFAATVLAAACSDDSQPATSVATPVLMPLAVGNEWVYTQNHYLHGQLDTTFTETQHIYRSKIDSLGRTCYSPIEKDTVLNGFPVTVWWVNTGQGYEMFGDWIGSFVFRFPVQAGYAYSLDTKLMYYNMVVSSTDTAITVPAGTFSCYRYDYYDKDNKYFATDFLSPGVGQVYRYISNSDSSMVMESVLLHFTLH